MNVREGIWSDYRSKFVKNFLQDNGNNNEKETNTSNCPCGCAVELPGVADARGGDKGCATKQKTEEETKNRHFFKWWEEEEEEAKGGNGELIW